MCFSLGGGGADSIAKEQRADEKARQARIKAGMSQIAQAFGGFNDGFYAKRATDYNAYAMPEVDRQQDIQRKNLIYALSRTGNLDSSAAITKNGELQDEGNKARIGVANTGLDEANKLRSQVEQSRGAVVAELNATGDANAAAASAMRATAAANQPAGFSPLGNLFNSFAQGLQAIGSRAGNNYGGFTGAGSAGLFSPGRSSMSVVGG